MGSAVIAACIAGVVVASASTLGGIRTADLAAASTTFATHSAGITATWGAVLSSTNWVLNSITLQTKGSDKFASGERIRLTLIDAAGIVICEIPLTSTLQSSLTIARTTIDSNCGATAITYTRIDQIAVSATA